MKGLEPVSCRVWVHYGRWWEFPQLQDTNFWKSSQYMLSFWGVFRYIDISQTSQIMKLYDNLAKGGMGLDYSLFMLGSGFRFTQRRASLQVVGSNNHLFVR